ncbi:osteoclast stimulatory transmembrane protein [Syngnathus typhle]|uniref:osteoclast stimulatory transmembrane protein n=1 Tax=Syngnathus typhle TaxID=161592 RepID=UPI002A6A7ECE|nr:osteoclast stimulatory transmembrane protein [Syngnathus typhle]
MMSSFQQQCDCDCVDAAAATSSFTQHWLPTAAMKFAATDRVLGPRRRTCREMPRATRLLLYLWEVYASARPVGRHLVTLTCLCLAPALLTGALVHRWLSQTLRCGHQAALGTALVSGAAALAAAVLCHPLRCALTVSLPTVCARQGRELLISASLAVLLADVIPNIGANVGAVVGALKCAAEGFSRTLLNSSELLNAARGEIFQEAVRAGKEDLSLVAKVRTLERFTRVDVSEVKSSFVKMIGQVQVNFSHMRNTLTRYKVLSNRILAAGFVALLIWESACYLKSYLTCVKFDNHGISKERRWRRQRQRKEARAPSGGGGGFAPVLRRFQISCRDYTPSVVSLLAVTFHFSAMALIAASDHVVYRTLRVFLPWLLDFPAMSANMEVTYKVRWFPPAFCIVPRSCVTRQLADLRKDYKWNFSPEASTCDAALSDPGAGASALLACLWLMSYLLVFLEAYAARLQRNICASFFKKQEARRVAYCTAKSRAERDGQETVFISCPSALG